MPRYNLSDSLCPIQCTGGICRQGFKDLSALNVDVSISHLTLQAKQRAQKWRIGVMIVFLVTTGCTLLRAALY